LRDCSTYKFQFTSFLKFESHNKREDSIVLALKTAKRIDK